MAESSAADTKMETSADDTVEEQPVVNGEESKTSPAKMEATNGAADDEDAEYAENEVYKNLRSQSVKPRVAVALISLYESTDMTPEDIDERAIEMLRSLPVEHAIFVIKEVCRVRQAPRGNSVKESNLVGVQNKAQFLMSIMRNFRDKVRQMGAAQALNQPLVNGPAPEKIKEILERTGYPLEVTIGQRKYGGPPPNWEGPITGPSAPGHEIYIGKIPKEIYEDSLITLFEPCGKIWDLRLMMDPLTGKNRGYAFLTFCEKSAANEAAKKYDGHEILPGKNLKVNVSVANTRLFIGNIPKSKSKEEILTEFKEHADISEGVTDCIIYSSPDAGENRKNRGFCFLDFVDHKAASDAKRKIHAGKIRPWNSDLVVDWAEQQEEPDDETMSKVKVLYVRNLKEAVTEEQLKEMFSAYGEVDRAKKIRDYAFIHFMERDPALKAMEALNNTVLEGVEIDISLAKPQGDKKKMMRGRGRGFGTSVRGGTSYGEYPTTGGYGMRGSVARGRGAPGGFGTRGGYGPPAADYGYGYDPYAAAYEDPYAYGMPGGYGYGYDPYSYGPDPYGSYGYGAPVMGSRGARGSAMTGKGGFAPRGAAGRGRMGRAGRGVAGTPRGAKRPGEGAGGPASKREFGGGDDFAADVNMSSF